MIWQHAQASSTPNSLLGVHSGPRARLSALARSPVTLCRSKSSEHKSQVQTVPFANAILQILVCKRSFRLQTRLLATLLSAWCHSRALQWRALVDMHLHYRAYNTNHQSADALLVVDCEK